MSKIVLKNICMIFNDQYALNNFSLEIKNGEFIVVVGPSGSGKSTLLRIIAGLQKPTSGEISTFNQTISMVFQNYRLFNHMSVYENIAFGIKKEEQKKDIEELANYLDIRHLLKKYPKELSGGEKQRVGIARALISKPQIVLMDEPLSNLDIALKQQLKTLIKSLHKTFKITFVYVTHDYNEAMTLSDRLVILNKGEIQQIAPPQDIYNNPSNTFVANFIGMNYIKIDQTSCLYPIIKKDNVVIGIRPEDIIISDTGISCIVDSIENLGFETRIYTYIDNTKIMIKTDHHIQKKEIFITFNLDDVCYLNE